MDWTLINTDILRVGGGEEATYSNNINYVLHARMTTSTYMTTTVYKPIIKHISAYRECIPLCWVRTSVITDNVKLTGGLINVNRPYFHPGTGVLLFQDSHYEIHLNKFAL